MKKLIFVSPLLVLSYSINAENIELPSPDDNNEIFSIHSSDRLNTESNIQVRHEYDTYFNGGIEVTEGFQLTAGFNSALEGGYEFGFKWHIADEDGDEGYWNLGLIGNHQNIDLGWLGDSSLTSLSVGGSEYFLDDQSLSIYGSLGFGLYEEKGFWGEYNDNLFIGAVGLLKTFDQGLYLSIFWDYSLGADFDTSIIKPMVGWSNGQVDVSAGVAITSVHTWYDKVNENEFSISAKYVF